LEVRDKSAEEAADMIFMNLISKSFILPCQLSVDTRKGIDSFQVHGLTSQIATLKSSEDNLVFKLEDGCRKNTKGIVRHLVVNNWKGDQDELGGKVSMSRLRSMTVFGKWSPFFSLDKMRLLRVLDLEDTSGLVDHHLKHIGKLLHLRYLSLRGCADIYHLPASLGNLSLLESLDVKGTKIRKLPKATNKLKNLQHVVAGYANDLYESTSGIVPKPMRNKLGRMTVFSAGFCVACCAPHCMKQKMDMDGDVNRRDVGTMCCCTMFPTLVTRRRNAGGLAVPRGIGKLKALLTLTTVNISGPRTTALQDIKRFSRLRKLGVAGINRSNGKELCSAITHLRLLESLSVHSDGNDGLVDCLDDIFSPPENLQSLKLYGRLGRLPDWINRLENLVKLKLQNSQLREGMAAMELLGNLPNLAILVLLEISFVGEDFFLYVGNYSFPSLLVLHLQIPNILHGMKFTEDAPSGLEVLIFGVSVHGNCKFNGLGWLQSLREVVFTNQGSEDMMENMRREVAKHCNRPFLKICN
jgi:hypothetical protein